MGHRHRSTCSMNRRVGGLKIILQHFYFEGRLPSCQCKAISRCARPSHHPSQECKCNVLLCSCPGDDSPAATGPFSRRKYGSCEFLICFKLSEVFPAAACVLLLFLVVVRLSGLPGGRRRSCFGKNVLLCFSDMLEAF